MVSVAGDWDAVVVGAGVAGGCTAALLADRGWRVLLVEKSAWPRESVCGGCLSASALRTLGWIGMHRAIRDATPTNGVVWHHGGRSFEHAIPAGVTILRVKLDAAIVERAIERGVQFMPGCCASLAGCRTGDEFRFLKLRTNDGAIDIRTRLVIASDGIGGTLLKQEPWAAWTPSPRSLMGVAATFGSDLTEILPGRIHMCMANCGYVGLVRIDNSTVHAAAAIDPHACQEAGGPVQLIGQILRSCQRSVPGELSAARLHGAGKLTRRRKQLGGYRVLTVGDACGYVEPVTGEGMAWAATGALALARLIPSSIIHWPADLPDRWRDTHWEAIGKKQRWCRAMRATIHHPAATAAGLFLGNATPGLARWIAGAICNPSRKDVLHDPIGHAPAAQNPQRLGADNPGHRHQQPARRSAGAVA
jgi:flavin-dependent dehydrogenase